MRDLHVGRSVTWPAAIASQAIGVLGMRGAGKSNLGRVVAEELFESSVPFVVFDPVGSWPGIRAGRDGRPAGGLPIPIFGGAQGDLPLDRTSGEKIADLIIDKQLSCVLDLSHEDFSEDAKQVFLAAFGDQLYRRKRRETGWLTLILEEADDYAPQPRSGGGVKGPAAKTLGVFQRLVRRGRSRGLGALMITQRSAAINKDLLYMVGTLVAFRTTGPRDQEAIDGWLKYNQPELRDKVMASLASLEDGEAWVIAQEALGSIERVRFRRMNTYDTGSTPEHGGQAKAATLADIDVPALSKELQATVEKAKAEDPRELQRQLREARAAIAKLESARPAPPPSAKAPRIVEKPVLKDAQVKRLETQAERLTRAVIAIQSVAHDVDARASEIKAAMAAARNHQANSATVMPAGPQRQAGTGHPAAAVVGAGRPGGSSRPAPAVPRPARPLASGALPRAERAILTAIAQRAPRPSTRSQASILSGYSIRSSSFQNALSALRAAGFIAGGGDGMTITESGEGALGDYPAMPSPGERLAWWAAKLAKAERALLGVVFNEYPGTVSRKALSERSGYSITSSSFQNALSTLRTLKLVEGRGDLRASAELFE